MSSPEKISRFQLEVDMYFQPTIEADFGSYRRNVTDPPNSPVIYLRHSNSTDPVRGGSAHIYSTLLRFIHT